jgi:hypothetical protein
MEFYNQEIMNKFCTKCGDNIPPQRIKALPSTKTCVGCSTVSQHVGMVTSYGEGDHSWVDLVIMDEEQLEDYKRLYINPTKKIADIKDVDSEEDEDEDKEDEIKFLNDDINIFD